MTTALTLVATLVILLAVGLAVVTGLKRVEARRREDFEEMAARRSWQLNITGEVLGRPAITRLQPRGGTKWVVESRRRSGDDSVRDLQSTEFSARDPHWSEGTMVMAGPLSPDVAALTGLMQGQMDGEMGEKLLTRLIGPGAAGDAGALRLQDGPDGVTILASCALGHRFETQALARTLMSWEPLIRGERGHPVLIISRDGVRVRLRHAIARAPDMERFIDLSTELARLGG
ncbi:hypothetical protein [Pseudoroseicyclus tamaricis]|uniref:Uncharacterized protein n=1 Tax=Pseudoroseicyclus tamaricis TaxID=2705421 RepID=A0A6B2JV24_9RHOB|nr:hypothetical protein [Pseudoroseicyclus tamaricis]NDV00479.1 hypothetical protein [Pseudoroseicyclus tamaricis]